MYNVYVLKYINCSQAHSPISSLHMAKVTKPYVIGNMDFLLKDALRQLQILTLALEDAKLTSQNIYIFYIDLKNALCSIDHARLLAIMENLGYSQDAVAMVGNIYFQSTTTYVGEC